MKFEYDIFISSPPASGAESQPSTEWAQKFSDFLSVLMERLYNRKPSIMLHDDLRIRQSMMGENARTLMGQSAAAIIILSPEFARSPAYLREAVHHLFTTPGRGRTAGFSEGWHPLQLLRNQPVQQKGHHL